MRARVRGRPRLVRKNQSILCCDRPTGRAQKPSTEAKRWNRYQIQIDRQTHTHTQREKAKKKICVLLVSSIRARAGCALSFSSSPLQPGLASSIRARAGCALFRDRHTHTHTQKKQKKRFASLFPQSARAQDVLFFFASATGPAAILDTFIIVVKKNRQEKQTNKGVAMCM